MKCLGVPVNVLAIVFTLCVTLVAGCGLQRTVFLYAPEQRSIRSDLTDGIASFEHNTDNLPDEVRGYEIYYKLYGESQNERIDEEENSILDPDTQALPRLESLNFVRLRRENEPPARPLVFIPFDERTNPVVITINFSGVDSGDAFFEREEDGETIRRSLVRTVKPGVYQAFTGTPTDYIAEDHDDIDDNAGAIDTDTQLQLVAYVLAYGEDPQELTPVYSFEARQLFEPPFDGLLE